jgi:hypothetical protein
MKTATKTIVGLIALLWVWSGALKLLAPDAFSAVLDAHGVISDGLILVTARGVPFIEICLGLGFAWTFGHRVSTLRLLVASLVLVSGCTRGQHSSGRLRLSGRDRRASLVRRVVGDGNTHRGLGVQCAFDRSPSGADPRHRANASHGLRQLERIQARGGGSLS